MPSSPAAPSRLPIWLVLAIVLVIHFPATSTSFCGFDDFNEVFRARFEDTPDPARMFTSPHFESFKYRPGNRVLTWLSTHAGQGAAWPFRWRNLLLHLLNVYLVYRLVLRLFGDRLGASASALLFGLHHLTHQNIHAAIFTNTFAYALILIGLLASLLIASSPRWFWLSAVAAAANFLAIFSYDPALFAAGLLPLYVMAYWICTRSMPIAWNRLAVHTAMQAATVAVTFVLRKQFVPDGLPSITPIAAIVRTLVSYAAAIAVPLDAVSAEYWLEMSLSKELIRRPAMLAAIGAVVAMVVVIAGYFIWRAGWHRRANRADWTGFLFLGGAALLAVLPTTLGSAHPSETYVYFATALALPALCMMAFRLLHIDASAGGRQLFWNGLILLVILFSAYDLTRSSMVLDCGNASRKILGALAADPQVAAGAPLAVARSPYDPPLRHVGVYGYVGLDTIGIGPFAAAALRNAMALTLHRSPVDAEVLDAASLYRYCASPPEGQPKPVCFLVHSDGAIEPLQKRPF